MLLMLAESYLCTYLFKTYIHPRVRVGKLLASTRLLLHRWRETLWSGRRSVTPEEFQNGLRMEDASQIYGLD